jgi:hypothetical protein
MSAKPEEEGILLLSHFFNDPQQILLEFSLSK